MKLFTVDGTIKCGRQTFNIRKYIIAESESEAEETYKNEHPTTREITVTYKYDVMRVNGPRIIAQEFIREK